MLNDHQTPSSSSTHQDDEDDENIREIHAHPLPPPASHRPRRDQPWETTSHRSSSLSVASAESENFTTMSREFNALVLAGTGITGSDNSEGVNMNSNPDNGSSNNLERIREEDMMETNPLAIVPDNNPMASPGRRQGGAGTSSIITTAGGNSGEVSVQRVKKEEVESKISAWQNAKISKINNRFKRDDAIINGWENEQVQKSSLRMKKVERKLEEKRAKAMEKMQNDIAKARMKAEERRATAEAKRGTKVARILEVANLMRVVGRAPTKRSFF